MHLTRNGSQTVIRARMSVCTLRAPGVCLALWKWNTRGGFDRERRKIQDTWPQRQEKREVGCGGRGSVTPSPGPSEWPRPVCTVTATFRGFAASKDVSGGRQSNSAASESRGSLHSYYPSFRGDSRGIGPQCLQGFLSQENSGFGLSMFVSGAPTFLSSCFCLPLPPSMKNCSLESSQ